MHTNNHTLRFQSDYASLLNMCVLDRQESFYLKKSSDMKARIKIDNSEETEYMLTKINGYKKRKYCLWQTMKLIVFIKQEQFVFQQNSKEQKISLETKYINTSQQKKEAETKLELSSRVDSKHLFFSTGPNSNYFRPCKPFKFCHHYSTLLFRGKHLERIFKQMSGRLALINFTKTGSKLQLELELLILVLGKIIKKKKREKKTKIGVLNSNILHMTKIF